jgi:rubredoxin
MSCPHCGAGEDSLLGVEISGVYDGVLFWRCTACGHAWNRWSPEIGRRWSIAQSYIDQINMRF